MVMRWLRWPLLLPPRVGRELPCSRLPQDVLDSAEGCGQQLQIASQSLVRLAELLNDGRESWRNVAPDAGGGIARGFLDVRATCQPRFPLQLGEGLALPRRAGLVDLQARLDLLGLEVDMLKEVIKLFAPRIFLRLRRAEVRLGPAEPFV